MPTRIASPDMAQRSLDGMERAGAERVAPEICMR